MPSTASWLHTRGRRSGSRGEPRFLGSLNPLRAQGWTTWGTGFHHSMNDIPERAPRVGAGDHPTPRAHNPDDAARAPCAPRWHWYRLQVSVTSRADRRGSSLCPTSRERASYHSVIPESAPRWGADPLALQNPWGRIFASLSSPATLRQRLRFRVSLRSTWVSHLLQDIAHACLTNEAGKSPLASARITLDGATGLATAPGRAGYATTPADGPNLWIPLEQDSHPSSSPLAAGLARSRGETFSVGESVHGL
ncbi:hypothetical protein DSL92_03790 [Billgrantia gudaonensis]|uniref:Uncharacterized protein n=1 Tax=Billgrantia gudaonensis TaxID=376427 RepID=A0A3S0QG48_9GAMM|nr:hypothetical protein DSL92_03790 [Halomonas gudaonensis]